jgi:hypothetical protein
MKFPRLRFTVRQMMVAVVVAGLLSMVIVRMIEHFEDLDWIRSCHGPGDRVPIIPDPIPGDRNP